MFDDERQNSPRSRHDDGPSDVDSADVDSLGGDRGGWVEERAPTLERPPLSRRPLAQLLGRVRPWVEWFGLGRLVVAAVTVVLVVAGGWWLLRAPAAPTEAVLPYASPGGATSVPETAPAGADVAPTSAPPSTPASSAPARLVVHVAGAVAMPGVYELPAQARVHAAIDSAGGLLADADPAALNLAAPLTDGERVYVSRVGEVPPVVAAPDRPPASVAVGPAAPTGPIDVNRASASELEELPGVGPATAQAIVDHREQQGPFATVDDLDAVRGIGPAKLAAMRDLVEV